MASNDDILQTAIIGIPRVAEKIVKLSDEQRQKAYEVVEQSYLQTVTESAAQKQGEPQESARRKGFDTR